MNVAAVALIVLVTAAGLTAARTNPGSSDECGVLWERGK